MKKYSNISSIKIEDKSTWLDKTFLTFDMDWAHDEIIQDTLNIINCNGVSSTWFVTHKSLLLSQMMNDDNIELGIHPNFNKILDGSNKENNTNSRSITEEAIKLVGNCNSIRSHSLTQSEKLLEEFQSLGLTHICNLYIPLSANIELKPFKLWDNITIVPHSWQDNVQLKLNNGFFKNESINNQNLKVFNFHPIHIYLNTENLNRYENSRHLHKNPNELKKYRYNGVGVRSFLLELLKKTKI
jgi:hypothetical protein